MTFRESVDAKGLSLDMELEPQLFFFSDENLLQKTLAKIVENAVKFTNDGGIRLKARCTDDPKGSVEITIRDTGIGIAREKQKIIFEEFRQAEEGYNRPYEGSGLGLSIARKTVEMLHGSIRIDSEPGTGTTFVIILPSLGNNSEMVIKDDETVSHHGMVETATLPADPPLILLVEDNEANIELCRMYLKKEFRLDVANSGEISLEMLKKARYRAILMDINLGPGMDGIDAITEIRKISEYLYTPIIAVTGYTFRNEKEYIISRGADYYLEKPFLKKDLIDLLKEVLSAIN